MIRAHVASDVMGFTGTTFVKRINLYDIPDEVMLVVEHPSGVSYQNQVGGIVCAQGELEGVLAPVELMPDNAERIMNFPYGAGRGISAAVADMIDAVLASEPAARYLTVDRARLDQSFEAWVFVLVASSESATLDPLGTYSGAPLGFGMTRGVLTWPNSD